MHRVVLTGIGLISVLGRTQDAVAAALYEGKSGIVSDARRLEEGFRSPLTGRIAPYEPSLLNRKRLRTMPSFAVQAYLAVQDALIQADMPEAVVRSEACGIVFGNDSTVEAAFPYAKARFMEDSTSRLGSAHLLRTMNSTVTMNLNVILGNQGGCWTVSAACASGLHAIGQATDCIRLGRQDVMICGGVQELNSDAVSAFDGINAFSVNPVPEEASRPFDARRDGLVPSGGSAALILEDLEHAKRRGARILGEILGYGISSDGSELVVPSATGLSVAMRRALKEAGLAAADVTHISAHATSTPRGDAAEAANIKQLFGTSCPHVMALKSLTGHEFWMSGASQLAYAAIMAEKGFSAGTPTFCEPDDSTRGINVLRRSVDVPPKRLLCNTAGFGGNNACLVVEFPCARS